MSDSLQKTLDKTNEATAGVLMGVTIMLAGVVFFAEISPSTQFWVLTAGCFLAARLAVINIQSGFRERFYLIVMFFGIGILPLYGFFFDPSPKMFHIFWNWTPITFVIAGILILVDFYLWRNKRAEEDGELPL